MEHRIKLGARERARLGREAAACVDARLRTRILIIIHSAAGWDRPSIAAALRCNPATISRVRARWLRHGRGGLDDRRSGNGRPKADPDFRATVRWMLTMSPPDFNQPRPTWTQPLLIRTARAYTGTTVSTTTMGRVLRGLKARLGRPKPLAPCPWSDTARNARVGLIRRMLAALPPDQIGLWEDEVDLDLNPKIGRDWMLPGTQRTVLTPGKNVKRYLALALEDRGGRLTWVSGPRKTTALFLRLLERVLAKHPGAKAVHVVLDNYTIHTSKAARAWLKTKGQRVRLHFLPPYCPDDNRVEREVCRELHANVTVNHPHRHIDDLLLAAHAYLRGRCRKAVAESRKAI